MRISAAVVLGSLGVTGLAITCEADSRPQPGSELRLAQATPTASPAQSAETAAPSAARSSVQLEEVIVTAQKRSERLQDVPVALSAVATDMLAQQGKDRIEDFFAAVPGLNFTGAAYGGGQQTLAVRGLVTTLISNPTVAITIDDVPFGSSTFLGRGSTSYPDVDPGILSRIEVLRGPQGTLYGASSIGGVIKFVTIDPSTEEFSGQARISSNAVDGGSVGYGASASVNVPVSDAFAVQASGFARRDPGYIYNVASGAHDVNEADVSGGRLATLWRVSDDVTLKLSGLFQNTRGDGNAVVDTDANSRPIFGDLKQSRLPGTEAYKIETRLYAATLTAKLGSVDFTSTTGYGTIKFTENPDGSLVGAFYTEALLGVTGASQPAQVETERFTQEVRLSSAPGQRIGWLAGAFFNDERSPYRSGFVGNDPVTGAVVGKLADYDVLSKLKEYSLFGDVTFNFTDRFDVQVGGRQAKIKQRYDETDTGPLVEFLGQPSPNVIPTAKTDEHAFTYLLTPRFRISPDLMVYARFASGYRPGGPNINAELSGNPLNFKPDKTYSYEVGSKGTLLDGSLTFDSSIYYVDWKDVQIQLDNAETFSVYTANAGGAKSLGAELSVQARPTSGLTLGAALALGQAELTTDFPEEANAKGKRGDRLPYSSKFSGNLSIDQEFALGSAATGLVGASVSYVGARDGEFSTIANPVRFSFPAYTSVDLHAGARHDSWSFDLFLNNVADKRGIVGGTGAGAASNGSNVIYVQPRTIGLSVTKTM